MVLYKKMGGWQSMKRIIMASTATCIQVICRSQVSDGTQYHYFTSHIGNSGKWIEVGVARFHWKPDEYVGYFKDSFLYKKEGNNYNAYWWNDNLPETTHSYGLAPVKVNRYIPEGSSSYKIDSWID